MTTRLDFELPSALQASAPPEAVGRTRDAVRMMVAQRSTGRLLHSTFTLIPTFLEPGDLMVVNTSATLPAAVDALSTAGEPVVVHLSTELDDRHWVVEPRRPGPAGSQRWDPAVDPPRHLLLGEGAALELVERHSDSRRLWVAELDLPVRVQAWLAMNGRPIRYGHVDRARPVTDYQNVYATDPGSAEMPSAGRPFTPEVITRLVAKGVGVTPVVLHTGVASLESDEVPYPERAVVPAVTADRINLARASGGRVVAIGTTVVRAVESAFFDGEVRPFADWTDLVITPDRGVRVVDGLLTGWHEPEASHLLMLEAVAGRDLLEASYREAIAEGYHWHEFGDVHLILP